MNEREILVYLAWEAEKAYIEKAFLNVPEPLRERVRRLAEYDIPTAFIQRGITALDEALLPALEIVVELVRMGVAKRKGA